MYIKSENAASHDSTNSVRFPEVTAHLADSETLRELASKGENLRGLAPIERLQELAQDLELSDPEDAAYHGAVDLEAVGLDLVDATAAPTVGLDDIGVDPEEARVEFDEEGTARVTKEIGELLADAYDGSDGRDNITIVEREDTGGDDGGDA